MHGVDGDSLGVPKPSSFQTIVLPKVFYGQAILRPQGAKQRDAAKKAC